MFVENIYLAVHDRGSKQCSKISWVGLQYLKTLNRCFFFLGIVQRDGEKLGVYLSFLLIERFSI